MKKIFYVFLCCNIFFLLIFSVYSKFQNSYNVSSSSKIARANLEVVFSNPINVNALNNNELIYEFYVRNFNEDVSSEVALEYSMEFDLSQDDAPINIELFRENGENVNLVSNKTVEKEILELGKSEKKYIAKFSYNENSENVMKDNLEVVINIKSVQEREENI